MASPLKEPAESSVSFWQTYIQTFCRVSADMGDVEATLPLGHLSKYLSLYYGKKVIILLDEYDTPMQEAYVNGYWEELTAFIRGVLNAAFKTNPYMERAILNRITRVGKESIFSDLNNLEVVSATSEKYEASFGFSQEEVWTALEDTAKEALAQIRRKRYGASLEAKGFSPGRIRTYGFAFEGKTVLIR